MVRAEGLEIDVRCWWEGGGADLGTIENFQWMADGPILKRRRVVQILRVKNSIDCYLQVETHEI